MTEDRKTGMQTAVEMTIDDSEAPPGAVSDQLPLIPADQLAAHEDLDSLPERRRGPGRPPGARNKSTNEWVEYLATRDRRVIAPEFLDD